MARRRLWGINLRIGAVVIGTVLFYTLIANTIPQIESEVPEELSFTGDVTPEQLIEKLKPWVDAGLGYMICYFQESAYDRSGLERFAREVLPEL